MGEANRRGNRELRVKLARAKRVDEIRKKRKHMHVSKPNNSRLHMNKICVMPCY